MGLGFRVRVRIRDRVFGPGLGSRSGLVVLKLRIIMNLRIWEFSQVRIIMNLRSEDML